MRSVVFFNHKGGVGKTTLVFNIGVALARQGRKVLFVDADAQANLTAVSMAPEAIERAYDEGHTIADALQPVVEGSGDLADVTPQQLREHAWLLPGHIRLSEYEEVCPEGWTQALAGRLRGVSVTTAMHRLAIATATRVGAEIILFDVGPNVGAMNRNILLSGDGFVVPLAPDLFSLNALSSVGRSATKWIAEWQVVIGSAARNKIEVVGGLPAGMPSPLGYISQQFAIYRQAPTEAYRRWLKQIPTAYRDEIRKPLEAAGVDIPSGPDLLGEVKNLSSLVPMAQHSNRAVFELSGSEARGAQYTRAQDTLEMFDAIANQIVARVGG